MIIKTYKCDACDKECKPGDITIIGSFPRRKYEYAKDALGVKICGFETMAFEETHLCSACLHRLLIWTRVIDEN